jgi:hypothetical protein
MAGTSVQGLGERKFAAFKTWRVPETNLTARRTIFT